MLLSVGVFLVIVFVFLQGISSISEGTRKRQRESLENAIMRSVTHCYAVEGAYPADLEYLKSHAPSLASPVLCTELGENQKIRLLATGKVKAGDALYAVDTYEG